MEKGKEKEREKRSIRISKFLAIPDYLIEQYSKTNTEREIFRKVSLLSEKIDKHHKRLAEGIRQWRDLTYAYVRYQARVESCRVTLRSLYNTSYPQEIKRMIHAIDRTKDQLNMLRNATRNLYSELGQVQCQVKVVESENLSFIETLEQHNVAYLPQQYRVLVKVLNMLHKRMTSVLDMVHEAESGIPCSKAEILQGDSWLPLVQNYAKEENATPPTVPDSMRCSEDEQDIDKRSRKRILNSIDSCSGSHELKKSPHRNNDVRFISSPIIHHTPIYTSNSGDSSSQKDDDLITGSVNRGRYHLTQKHPIKRRKINNSQSDEPQSPSSPFKERIPNFPDSSEYSSAKSSSGKENQEVDPSPSDSSTQQSHSSIKDLLAPVKEPGRITRTAVALLRANTK